MGIVPLMIECHLVADFLVEMSYKIKERCQQYGFTNIIFGKDLQKAIKANECFASFLTKVSPELCNLIVRNEMLNAALHKKYVSYINQRLAKPKKKSLS